MSLNDLVEVMHIADGLECETNDFIAFYKDSYITRIIWNESLSDYWMSWDSTIEENTAISMMCFFYSVWKVAFDYLTENDFKGDVNEIGDDDYCILEVFLFLPPAPEVMLNKLLEMSKKLEETQKEIQDLKKEVASLKAFYEGNEGDENNEGGKKRRTA